MPRIYYRNEDRIRHTSLFLLHCFVYAVSMALIWRDTVINPPALTVIWTALLAYHAYWHTPLQQGLQQRTYNHLRNQFGTDWDLAATAREFELAIQKAAVEIRLARVLPDTALTSLAVLAAWAITLLADGDPLPLGLFAFAAVGLSITTLVLQIMLRARLRDTLRDVQRDLKKRSSHTQLQVLDLQNQMPRPGMTFAVGDDGELVEVPVTQQES